MDVSAQSLRHVFFDEVMQRVFIALAADDSERNHGNVFQNSVRRTDSRKKDNFQYLRKEPKTTSDKNILFRTLH